MTTVVSWKIAKREQPWNELLKMDADVALLQEAGRSAATSRGRMWRFQRTMEDRTL